MCVWMFATFIFKILDMIFRYLLDKRCHGCQCWGSFFKTCAVKLILWGKKKQQKKKQYLATLQSTNKKINKERKKIIHRSYLLGHKIYILNCIPDHLVKSQLSA